jgi:hypothetical protein
VELVGSFSPEAESVEQLILDTFDDLTYPGYPPPQALGPPGLLGVALGWMDDLRAIVLEPAARWFSAPSKTLSVI